MIGLSVRLWSVLEAAAGVGATLDMAWDENLSKFKFRPLGASGFGPTATAHRRLRKNFKALSLISAPRTSALARADLFSSSASAPRTNRLGRPEKEGQKRVVKTLTASSCL